MKTKQLPWAFGALAWLLAWPPWVSAQQAGNVWHLPRQAEPSGVPSMRNPAYGILRGSTVQLYNGSYSLDGNQIGGFLWIKPASSSTYQSLPLSFDAQNGNNKYWRAAVNTSNLTVRPGEMVSYYFEIVFSDRATTYIHGDDTHSSSTLFVATAQASPFGFRIAVPWPGGPAAGYPSDPASRVHHWKEEAVVGNGYMTVMLDQNGSIYDIYYPSVGSRHGVSAANEGYRGPEEFPACASLDQQANGQMNVVNGMGGFGLGTNIYWMKNQAGGFYTNVQQQYLSDANVVRTTMRLNCPEGVIEVTQDDFCPAPASLPIVASGGRTNYGVYLKRFHLWPLTPFTNAVWFYFDMNFNVNGANANDVMSFDTTSNRNTMVVYDNTARAVTGGGCGPNGYDVEYNPATYSPYDKNASVWFATAMKARTTSEIPGLMTDRADGSWRDHTPTDHHEGWIGKLVELSVGEAVMIDVIIVGSWDDFAGATGTHNFWGVPIIDWFYTNDMAAVQAATEQSWRDWLDAGVTVDFPGTSYDTLWKRSLLVSALHVDGASGAILAGMHNGAYPFVWPRDGVYAANTFARTGHTNEALAWHRWLRDTAYRATDSGIGGQGFFYQKYTTDGHQVWTAPQVDETASVPWGAWFYYLVTGDRPFLTNYWNLVYTSARASSEDSALDSRLNYNDTYNLMDGMSCWEDAFGLFLYSNASVERGLRDAARFAGLLGQTGWASTFQARANAIKTGLDARLEARVEPADISHLGLVMPYETYSPADPRMTNMIEWLHGRQAAGGFTDNLVEPSGDTAGLLRRYNHNVYGGADNYWNGGPWFLATAWYGEYYARWQDYAGGKALIDVNKDKLDRLLAKLGPLGLGAEQIASGAGAQKYPGFWLQTAWPNVWESHSTLLDQMMMFLDYQPLTNAASFAPKLPTGWTNLSFRNLLYHHQRFDISVTETASSTRAGFNKLTAGPLDVKLCLRIPPGQAPVLVGWNTNFAAPSPSSYDTNTGRVQIEASLASAPGSNAIFVTYGDADTDGDGLPDAWELANTLHPLLATGDDGAAGDPDRDGFNNLAEYLAGTDPRDPASLLRIVTTGGAGRTIFWSSITGKTYQVICTTNVSLPFVPLSGSILATNVLTSYEDTNSAGSGKFYRVQVAP